MDKVFLLADFPVDLGSKIQIVKARIRSRTKMAALICSPCGTHLFDLIKLSKDIEVTGALVLTLSSKRQS